jgi:putative membrane protein
MDTINNHLANERTFLAWIRTSFSIIIFGFVVARFGVALREFFLLQHKATNGGTLSLEMGVGCMAIGVIFAMTALIRYQVTRRRIDTNQFKPANFTVVFLGLFAAVFGAVLIVYLIQTAAQI